MPSRIDTVLKNFQSGLCTIGILPQVILLATVKIPVPGKGS
jgi:hypothetical protein